MKFWDLGLGAGGGVGCSERKGPGESSACGGTMKWLWVRVLAAKGQRDLGSKDVEVMLRLLRGQGLGASSLTASNQ